MSWRVDPDLAVVLARLVAVFGPAGRGPGGPPQPVAVPAATPGGDTAPFGAVQGALDLDGPRGGAAVA